MIYLSHIMRTLHITCTNKINSLTKKIGSHYGKKILQYALLIWLFSCSCLLYAKSYHAKLPKGQLVRIDAANATTVQGAFKPGAYLFSTSWRYNAGYPKAFGKGRALWQITYPIKFSKPCPLGHNACWHQRMVRISYYQPSQNQKRCQLPSKAVKIIGFQLDKTLYLKNGQPVQTYVTQDNAMMKHLQVNGFSFRQHQVCLVTEVFYQSTNGNAYEMKLNSDQVKITSDAVHVFNDIWDSTFTSG